MSRVLGGRRGLVLESLGERPRLPTLTVEPLQLRLEGPRDQVPPVVTPAWIRHLEHFRDGARDEAREAAEAKLDDPAA